MATRRTQPAIVDQSGTPQTTAADVAALFPEEETPNDVALLSVLEQIGESDTECSVNVYRIVGEGGKNVESYLQKFTPAEFSRDGLDELRRLYGGGDYRIRVYGPAGKLIANKRIAIEAPKGFKPGMQQEMEQAGGIRDLATAMQAGFHSIAQTIAQALQATQRPQESRTDFLKELAMMREIFKSDAPAPVAQNTEGKAIEMFLKGIQLARETLPKAGEATETDLLLEGIRMFGGPIAQAMQQSAIAKSAPAPGTVKEAPPVPTIPAQAFPVAVIPNPDSASAGAQTQPQGDNMQLMVKQALAFLVQQAKADNDPATYAALVLDHVSEEEVKALVTAPDWTDKLALLNPDVRNHVAWFEELKEAILAELTTPENSAIPASNATP